MRKYIFLIPLFLFACKKEDKGAKISIRQQPSKIAVFDIDTGTGTQTLRYEINYFYNESSKRFDSIIVAGKQYVFDYSKINTDNKILLNIIDGATEHDEIVFDSSFYSLITFNEIALTGIGYKYNLSYDGNKRITSIYSEKYFVSKNFTYKNDSVFMQTSETVAGCNSVDTIVNTFYDMSTALPYLLFADINGTCGSLSLNILKTLPLSNYINKLPSKITNDTVETTYSYTGDSKSRLAEALIVTKSKYTNRITQKLKFVITY